MKFSIITPAMNWNKFTRMYVDSMNGINHNNFEVIIVNDSSTDDVIEFLEKNVKCNYKKINQENS